jgi:hypothetical protein
MKSSIDLMNEPGCCLPNARQCSAQSKRTGCRCRAPAMTGKNVCRFHGGKSVGRPGPANGMYRHGRYTLEAQAERQRVSELLREAREVDAILASALH